MPDPAETSAPSASPARRAVDLGDRTIFITGGTDGIGKATAAHLAGRGATVAIVGSTAAKGKRAAQEIADEAGTNAVTFLQANLSRMQEARRTAVEVARTPARLAVDVALEAMNGRFFSPEGDEIDGSDDLQDLALRQRLWRVSEELSGLAEEHAAPTP